MVKPAEAERQATIIRAEGEQQALIIRAGAVQKHFEAEGAGEASKIQIIGRAEADKLRAIGEAEASVEKLPELAQAFATQLSGIDKINIIDMGGGGSGGGMGKVIATVGGGMTAMFAMLKDQFGIDVAHLMQGKPDAVPEHVASEVVVAFDESEERKKTVREAPFARNGASHA